jgi:transposase
MVRTARNLARIESPSEREGAVFLFLEEQKNLIEKQSETIARQEHTIKLLQKALFGQKSEKIVDTDERQGVFEGILGEVDELNPEDVPAETPQEKNAESPKKSNRNRRSLQELIPDDLPREEVVIDLPEEKKTATDGTVLKRIGEDRVEKLAYRPGHWFVKEFIYPKYANPSNAIEGVKRAPAPDFAVPGGILDESMYAWAIYSKFALHLPHYRLEEMMRSGGLDISRQTLSSGCVKAAEKLRPLYELMKKDIIDRAIIFADETPVKMLNPGTGKTKKTYIWVYAAGGKGPPFRIFDFTLQRNHSYPKKMLKNFTGYLHADAFDGYNPLFKDGSIVECGCWMHVRRKFFEAEDAPPEVRNLVLRKIRNIYRYERAMKKLDRETKGEFIMKVRDEKIRPLIDDLFAMTAAALTQGLVMPKSSFAGAITYMHNLGKALYTFLENPYLQPDNGTSERALRPFTIGRKNWIFLGSCNGGDAAGILMSLVQTCRVMNIDVFTYLDDVLRRINGHPVSRLAELLPGNWQKSTSYYN